MFSHRGWQDETIRGALLVLAVVRGNLLPPDWASCCNKASQVAFLHHSSMRWGHFHREMFFWNCKKVHFFIITAIFISLGHENCQIASSDIVTITYVFQSNVWLSSAVLQPDQFSSRLMMKVWVLEMKQVWMEGEMKERESGTRTSNRAAASPLSYHRNTSYTLCCPRIELESAYFLYVDWTRKQLMSSQRHIRVKSYPLHWLAI